MLQAKLEMEPSTNGPHGHHGGHTHFQIWSKAKIFQKGLRTSFLNQNNRY